MTYTTDPRTLFASAMTTTSDHTRWANLITHALEVSLEDVAASQASSTTILVAERDPRAFVSDLSDSALRRGFAVATASLSKHPFDDLHGLVGAFAETLRAPRVRDAGLPSIIESFVRKHGKHASKEFARAADEAGLFGELRELADRVVATNDDDASRALAGWLAGRKVRTVDAPLSLADRSARSALFQLTRIALALGARGTLLIARNAETLTDLPAGRRDTAYSVLRELIDDNDGLRGMSATKLLVVGEDAVVERRSSIYAHEALAMRIGATTDSLEVGPLETVLQLHPDPVPALRKLPSKVPVREAPEPRQAAALRSIIRLSQGVPAVDHLTDLTVGADDVDARVEQLFDFASHDASVFAVLRGEFGSGKTHQLLYLEHRAGKARRPVFRLSVERLDEDLGNPQRHLRRLLESSVVPVRGEPTAIDRLASWLASDSLRARLIKELLSIAEDDSEASRAAVRCVRTAMDDEHLDSVLLTRILTGEDLVDRPGSPSYRQDAYSRFLLWCELLTRLDGCEGPVIVLDEAENLYRLGVSRPERRTALRSLAFYCGGAIPKACVVLAVTPGSLGLLRSEAEELLSTIEEQSTVLETEDVTMLRRRLLRARPIDVYRTTEDDLISLAGRTRRLHVAARGKIQDDGWDAFVALAANESGTPREFLRAVTLRLERLAYRANF